VLPDGASGRPVQFHEVKKLRLTVQPGMKVTMLFGVEHCQLIILWKSVDLSGKLLSNAGHRMARFFKANSIENCS
jgi:hypothetical protein